MEKYKQKVRLKERSRMSRVRQGFGGLELQVKLSKASAGVIHLKQQVRRAWGELCLCSVQEIDACAWTFLVALSQFWCCCLPQLSCYTTKGPACFKGPAQSQALHPGEEVGVRLSPPESRNAGRRHLTSGKWSSWVTSFISSTSFYTERRKRGEKFHPALLIQWSKEVEFIRKKLFTAQL